MAVSIARPDVSELGFHLFARSVHPELLEVCARTHVEQREYSATITICRAGHSVSFHTEDQTITEVASTLRAPLPQRKRLFKRKLCGTGEESLYFDCGLSYHVNYQLELLAPEVFLNFHEEMLIDTSRAVVSHSFSAQNRLAPSALSLIRTDVWQKSLLVHAFHTFPENCAVVKSQTLFEF